MQIILYNVKYKKTDVKKNLVDGISYEGSLRYPTNLLNPIVRLDLTVPADNDNTKFITIDYTYAYIPIFNRYYFIQNKVLVSTSIIDIYLHIDVLHTYIGATNAILRNENVFVERSSDSQIYDTMYEDDRLSFRNYNSQIYELLDNTDYDIEFKELGSGVHEDRNVIVSVGYDYAYQGVPATPQTNYPNVNNSSSFDYIFTGYSNGYIIYALSFSQAQELLCKCLTNDTYASHIRNIQVLPFSLPTSSFHQLNNNSKIYLGQHQEITLSGGDTSINVLNDSMLSFKGFDGYLCPDGYDVDAFYKTGNYAKYQLFIPFVGWVDIESSRLLDNQEAKVFYNFNFDNGDCNYVLTFNDELYYTAKCSIGINIAPNTTNAYENSKKNEAIAAQEISTQIASGIALIAGIALTATGYGSAGGIPLIIGGVGGFATSTGVAIAQGLQVIDQGQKGTSTPNNGLYLYDTFVLKIVRKEIVQPLTGAWLNENGRPTKVNRQLKLLKGYAEIGKCDFSIGSTEEEKELIDLLSQGVHFPTTSGW